MCVAPHGSKIVGSFWFQAVIRCIMSSYEILSMLLLDTFRCFAWRGMNREQIVHTFLVNGFWNYGGGDIIFDSVGCLVER